MPTAFQLIVTWWNAVAALSGMAVYYGVLLRTRRNPLRFKRWQFDPPAVVVLSVLSAWIVKAELWSAMTVAAQRSATETMTAPERLVRLLVIVHNIEVVGEFWASIIVPALLVGLVAAMARIGTSKRAEPPREVTEGPCIRDGSRLQHAAAKKRAAGRAVITFGGVEVAPEDEQMHFVAIGTTGTGKSVSIRDALDGARARGDRAILADSGGAYLSRYYRPGDVIMNPLDIRAHAWDILAEAPQSYLVDGLAAALFPSQGSASDAAWNDRARTLLSSVLEVLRREPGATVKDVFRLVAQASREELAVLLADTPAIMFLNGERSNVFDNLRASASAGMRALRRASQMQGEPFSIRQWATSDSKAWIFLSYLDDQKSSLDSLIGAMMSLAISSLMSRPEGDFPTWIVADELDAIGPLNEIDNATVRVRKFGGRCILGFQTVKKIKEVYGPGAAQAIFENCKTRLFLQCSGSDADGTARWASAQIGEVTYWKSSLSKGKSRGSSGTGAQRGQSDNQTKTLVSEPAVRPSAIEGLPKFGSGYLKRPGDPDWYKVKFPYDAWRKPVAEPFVPLV